jgi:endonuclease G
VSVLIRPSVIAAAEKRVPVEVVATESVAVRAAAEAAAALIPPVLSEPDSEATLARRAASLALGGAKPSTTELERLLGNNDLVDEFYLQRALVAARPVMRIILRDAAGRERGWATGFMVSPRLMLTNWHVFSTQAETTNAIAEAQYVLDIAGNPAPSYRFAVRGDLFYTSNQQLDFALVAVEPSAQDGRTPLAQFGYHRLIAEPNKIREGESMTLIQHPGGERRQFAIRENQLLSIREQFLWYKSDTAPGSSGAPAFNDSFQVVALHHSGAARRDANGRYILRDGTTVASLEGIDDSRIDWIANEGLRVSVLCAYLRANLRANSPYGHELFQAMQGGDVMSNAIRGNGAAPLTSSSETTAPPANLSGNVLTIPLQLQVSLSLGGAGVTAPSQPDVRVSTGDGTQPKPQPGTEALRYPIVDRDYSTRRGYDPNFLKVPAPLPEVKDQAIVSKMADGNFKIPYEHFTIVLNKKRRLPLFTAANVDYSQPKRRPEPGDYSRDGLTGLGPNDQEKWFTDPRIPQQDQLPDVFYTKDGGSFDKGHVVRRDDMCWGTSRAQIVRANGDTFHVTNCTPQIAGFNRSTSGEDNWGDLEDEIQKQAKTERLSIFAGPILAKNDKFFEGRDDFGPVRIQIPREYWKVVLANNNGKLAAFAFILQQDLQDVPLEFKVTATWKPYLVSLKHLESRLSGFVFPQALHAANKAVSGGGGHELANALGASLHPSLTDADTGADVNADSASGIISSDDDAPSETGGEVYEGA